MTPTIIPLQAFHAKEAMTIFNYYIQHTFSSYFESPLPEAFFERLLLVVRGYPALVAHDDDGTLLGFGYLQAYQAAFTFKHTAELTMYIHPDHTRKGIASSLLGHLAAFASSKAMTSIVANTASRNTDGMAFLKKTGFVERGTLVQAGTKFNQLFDVVYLQRPV